MNEARFWAQVDVGVECWTWKGAREKGEYGRFYSQGRRVRAHRLAWMLTYGAIPAGLLVLHACDNPPCVRPDHLWLGTDRDNADDKIGKLRQARRTSNAASKLTEEQVTEIRQLRAAGATCRALAPRFGVSNVQISNVSRGKSWKSPTPVGVAVDSGDTCADRGSPEGA